ncbi:hypothetical protein IAG41_10095 [Sphingomonas sp. JC676]|uniref:hypothetical protein n=1 Tax=Sphingomonas sp. JC676 TaxID=2768065 RepID=UPI0016580211|nr:hypothetical protein [Sphingomonas sp. JC676]MBC9032741.1 hypothetical protein [Sphingomonas sp. JC676]
MASMHLYPMDVPAEIHRWIEDDEHPGHRSGEVIVAKGPLVIMAHGICAIDPVFRRACWITSEVGDLNAEEAEEALRYWSTRAEGADEEA